MIALYMGDSLGLHTTLDTQPLVFPKPRPKVLDINVCAVFLKDDFRNPLLSFDEILKESITQKNPEGVTLPTFETYSTFIESDFFHKYYKIDQGEIQYQTLYDIIEKETSLGYIQQPSNDSMKVQRMLLVLGYLQISNFDGIDYDSGNTHESDVSYFGILLKNEDKAIKKLQENYGLKADGIVGNLTQELFYRLIYAFFHSIERDSCRKEYTYMRNDLKQGIQ